MQKIKVSVIMAVYNSELYLRQALESLVCQTLQEIEIICVNDGSSDHSLDILKEYEKREPRIKVVNIIHEGKGAAHARNIGLSMARGEFVSILDSDDFFELEMLEKAYAKAKQKDVDIVLYDAFRYDNTYNVDRSVSTILMTEHLPDKDCFRPEEHADEIFFITGGMAWNGLFRRKMILDNNLEFYGVNHADDLVFSYLGYVYANKIAILNERLMHYRINTGTSQSDKKSQWPESGYLAFYFLKQKLMEKGLYYKYQSCFIRRSLSYAFFYLESMKELKSYHKLFYDLKNEYLEKLGAYEMLDDEFEEFWIEKRDAIKNGTPEEYLFFLRHGTIFSSTYYDILRGAGYLEKVPTNQKIALYGAGMVGSYIFANLVLNKKWEVVTWVDRNYRKIGFPVQDPGILHKFDFDICYVAIENYFIFDEVRSELKKQGVEENKIWWIMNEDLYLQQREEQERKKHGY